MSTEDTTLHEGQELPRRSTKRIIPESPTRRRQIRTQYKEMVMRGTQAQLAAKRLGYSKNTIYRMFLMDGDNWRAHYSEYDAKKYILEVKVMMEKGMTSEDACMRLGIPHYKWVTWKQKYGVNPLLPAEPKIHQLARKGAAQSTSDNGNRVKRKYVRKIFPEAVPAPVKQLGVLGALLKEQAALYSKVTALEDRYAKLIEFLGMEEN